MAIQVDVTKDSDQGGDGSAGLLAEDPADLGRVDPGCVIDVARRQAFGSSAKSANGRTSIGTLIVAVVFDAQASAASRSSASMM